MKNRFTCAFNDLPRYVTVLLCLVFSVNAFAQNDTSKLKEVKISSSSIPQVQTALPSQSVSDFSQYGSLNVADAVANFAGVSLHDYGGIGGLKTISVRGLSPNHTGVSYNGILMNDAQNGQVDLGKFNLSDVQEITLYNGQSPRIVQPARSFASASVLDIVTLQPHLSIEKPYQFKLGLSGGSFGLINPAVQWQQRINKQWSVILNGNYTGANGRYKYKNEDDGSDTLATRINGDIKAIQTDGAVYWSKNDSSKFALQFNYYNSDRGLPDLTTLYDPYSHERMQDRDLFIQSSYEHTARNSFHLLLSSKFSQNYTHYSNPDFYNDIGHTDEHYKLHEFYQSAAVGYHILPAWELGYASDVSVSNLQLDVYNYAVPTRVTFLNAFSTDVNLGKWHLQGNVLHTYIDENAKSGAAGANRSVFSPTLSASFKPFTTAAFLLRAFYKDIFRAPTFSDLYYYNPTPRNVKPEYTEQYDLGATYSKNIDGIIHSVAFTVDAYYNHVKDKIVYLPQNSGIFSATNLGLVDIKGLDATFKAIMVPAYNWLATLSANYTYQRVQDVTNPNDSYYLDQIPYTPRNTLNFNAGINHRQLGLYYNYTLVSSRYRISNNDPEYYMPPYHLSNVSLVWHFFMHKLPVMASFDVDNLGNLNYSIIKYYPMPRRSFRLSMQITI